MSINYKLKIGSVCTKITKYIHKNSLFPSLQGREGSIKKNVELKKTTKKIKNNKNPVLKKNKKNI